MNTGNIDEPLLPLYTIRQNALNLRAYVEGVRHQENAWHVDLVAHSMGGLISRFYLSNLMRETSDDGYPVVNHFAMLGTPNLGSPCANISSALGWQQVMIELRPDVVRAYNRMWTQPRAIPFSIYAGDPLANTCHVLVHGDGVVPLPSALAIDPVGPRFARQDTQIILHTDMTVSQYDFTQYVLPLLNGGPDRAHETSYPPRAGLMSFDDMIAQTATQSEEDQPQIIYHTTVTLTGGETRDLTFDAPAGDALVAMVMASDVITAHLVAPDSTDLGPIDVAPFRTRWVTEHDAGQWAIELENESAISGTAIIAVVLHGGDVVLDVAIGDPGWGDVVPIMATLRDTTPGRAYTSPSTVTMTATLTGIQGGGLVVALVDDGAHGDGEAGDGVYGAIVGPLAPDVYGVYIEAEAAPTVTYRATSAAFIVPTAALRKSVQPASPVEPGDTLTYTLVISATEGAALGLYDPLEDVDFAGFINQPGSLSFVDGAITGTVTMPASEYVTVTFVTTVTASSQITITNQACVYPEADGLTGCLWSNATTMSSAPVVDRHDIFLPVVLRNYDPSVPPPSYRYVRVGGVDSGACRSPATACATVQYAIDAAEAGDVIAIAGYVDVYTHDNPSGSTANTYHQVTERAKPGGYYGADTVRQVALVDKNLTLRGGYSNAFTERDPTIYKTVLRPGLGGSEGRGILITGEAAVTLEDIHILDGDATGLGGGYDTSTYDVGGGIFAMGLAFNSQPLTLRRCTVAGSVASRTGLGEGGGLFVENRDGVLLIGNVIADNTATVTADGNGGGLAATTCENLRLEQNTISGNRATSAGRGQGGGLYLKNLTGALVQQNAITGNLATATGARGIGGGIYVTGITQATLTANTIRENGGGGYDLGAGGGFSCYQSSGLTVSRNVIVANAAAPAGATLETSGGGGIRVGGDCTGVTLENNVIAANTAPFGGGGLLVAPSPGESPSVMLRHNTFVGNSVPTAATARLALPGLRRVIPRPEQEINSFQPNMTPTDVSQADQAITTIGTVTLDAVNTIIAGHDYGVYEIYAGQGALTFDTTLWYNNTTDAGPAVTRANDRTGDPAFVAPQTYDYHIGAGSAARDAGANAGVAVDLDGQPRDSAPDIGADEYQ